ncbi:MAG: UDP-glucose 4-epimerase GalE [Phycisphaerae bacterium]|jgi:UDP-glucose 4-epimerase
MRVFVTGGAGYVGSHCVRRLILAGHDVTVFDNLSFGHRAAIAPQATLIEGDLADRDHLQSVLTPGSFDAVMHFAAFINVGESVDRPLRYYRNNVANTLNLLETMEEARIRRLVFSSTCAVYGEPEDLPLRENMPRAPINPYGAAKLAVEHMIEYSAAAWGLGAMELRYFNASGAAEDGTIGEDHSPETHLIPLILQVPLGQREAIKVFGTDYPTPDGTCVRDYIHVIDLAEAHLLAVEQLREGEAEALNVGTGTGVSVFEVIAAARQVTGHEIPAEPVSRRPGDPPSLFADATRIQARLGWAPRYRTIDAIVASAWKWHQGHPNGFADR